MGLVFALLGGGGGVIAVPTLLALFDLSLMEATAGGLAVVWAAAVTGTLGHARAGRVRWRVVALLGVPSMFGAVAGARLHPFVPEAVTRVIFSVVLLAAAAALARPKREPVGGRPAAGNLVLATTGLALGALTGFLGVGGGFLIVPALVLLAGLRLREAVGTSLAIIAASSLTGAASYLVAGHAPLALVLPVGVGAVLGALAGAPLAGRLPERWQRRAFIALSVSVALVMAWGAVHSDRSSPAPAIGHS